jgi:hypothetical protein
MISIDYPSDSIKGVMRDTRTERTEDNKCGHVSPVHGYRCTLDRYHNGDHVNQLRELAIRWDNDSKSVEDTRAYLETITAQENTCTKLAGENTHD